jgi:hypothetical protein
MKKREAVIMRDGINISGPNVMGEGMSNKRVVMS